MSAKPKDTPKVKVIVSPRNPDSTDAPGLTVSTNDVIENGKKTIKTYHIKFGEAVEIPETVAEQIKAKYEVVLGKDNEKIRHKLYIVEAA